MEQAGLQLGGRRVVPEVVDLAGVFDQVEQLAVFALAVYGDLVALVDVASHVEVCQRVAVFGDAPRAHFFPFTPARQLIQAGHHQSLW